MLSRRTLIQSAMAFTAMPVWAAEAQKPIEEGKDYTLVTPPLKLSKRPIVIHEFFAYTCPHCLRFAPLLEAFRKSVETDDSILIIPVPVAWEKSYELFPRIYYAFEALGRLPDLHMPFWEWVMDEDHPWESVRDAKRDIDKWIAKKGIAADVWNQTLESFAVSTKVRHATDTWKNYNIDSTPCVGIAGRYITAPHLTGSRPRTIAVIKDLVERIRREG